MEVVRVCVAEALQTMHSASFPKQLTFSRTEHSVVDISGEEPEGTLVVKVGGVSIRAVSVGLCIWQRDTGCEIMFPAEASVCLQIRP